MFDLVLKYLHTKKSSETETFWVILNKELFGAGCVSVFIILYYYVFIILYYRGWPEKIKAISTIYILAATLYIMTGILAYIWET